MNYIFVLLLFVIVLQAFWITKKYHHSKVLFKNPCKSCLLTRTCTDKSCQNYKDFETSQDIVGPVCIYLVLCLFLLIKILCNWRDI